MTTTDLAVVEHDQGYGLSMVDGPDPMAAMEYAAAISKAIASVLSVGNGLVNIQGRPHVEAAGWQTIAAMTGHTCEIEWSRMIPELEHHSGLHSWEARAVVRDQSGRVVATGESMAAAAEGDPQGSKKGAPWARAEFSIRSMAQTRAMGRALSARMRYVVQLAGFAGVAAEEMGAAESAPIDPLALARARWKVMRDTLGQGTDVIKGRVGDKPERLADDDHFAYVAFMLGVESVERAAAEPVEGEVVEDVPTPIDGVEVISDGQRKRLFAVARKAGVDEAGQKAIVMDLTGQDSRSRIPVDRYDAVMAAIEAAGDEAVADALFAETAQTHGDPL